MGDDEGEFSPVDEKDENIETKKGKGQIKPKKPITSREDNPQDEGYYAVHLYAFPLLDKNHDKPKNQKKAIQLSEKAVLTNIEDGEVTGVASDVNGLLLYTTTGLRFYRWERMCDDSPEGLYWSDRKNPCYAPVWKDAYYKVDNKGHGFAFDIEKSRGYHIITINGIQQLRSFNVINAERRYTKFIPSDTCTDGNPQDPKKDQLNGAERYNIGKKELTVISEKCVENPIRMEAFGLDKDGKVDASGKNYKGCQAQTVTGLACGLWSEGPQDNGNPYGREDILKKELAS